MSIYAVTLSDVHAAANRLAGHAQRTPVLTCSTLDRRAGKALYFKCEQFQKVGAFKFRGAWNAIARLDPQTAANGVVTHSSGNHAQALALAAKLRGIPAHIVMPANASPVKKQAVEDYGARVILCEPTLLARETTAAQVLAETQGTLIPPYDHADVIAGQGTAVLELLAEIPDLDAVITPVGGGGLLAGTCIAGLGVAPTLRIFGAEPAGADDAARSKAAGRLIPQTGPKTIADGLLTSLGQLTWPILRDQVEQIITVSEAEIVTALQLAWERGKLLIEPSSAVALAAVLSETFRQRNDVHRVGIILSGGNVNLSSWWSSLG